MNFNKVTLKHYTKEQLSSPEAMQLINETKRLGKSIMSRKAGVIFGLGLLSGLTFMMISGLARGNIIESNIRKIPNQGIWKSLQNAALIGFSLMIFFGSSVLVSIFVVNISGGMSVVYGLCFSFFSGLSAILFFGGSAWIQHFVLRFILFANRFLPWNLARFLDYAADHILLRKVGGGYIFIHRLLLEYFAALGEENDRNGR